MDDGSPAGKIATIADVRPDPPKWRRSGRCAAAGTCVEVARVDDLVLVRDAGGDGGVIALPAHAWRELLAWLRNVR